MITRNAEPILITDPANHRRAEDSRPIPSLSVTVAERVRMLEGLTRIMDEAIAIPGLRTRVGLDSLIGLVPGLGDLVSGAIACWIVNEARQLGASKWLLSRMMANVGADMLFGAVPLAGDLFDVYFSNCLKNGSASRVTSWTIPGNASPQPNPSKPKRWGDGRTFLDTPRPSEKGRGHFRQNRQRTSPRAIRLNVSPLLRRSSPPRSHAICWNCG